MRSHYPYLKNDRAALAFRSATKTAGVPEKYYQLSWSELHETRSRLRKAAEGLLEKTEFEKRDLSEGENLASKYAVDALDALQEEFEIRKARDTKDPVDFSNGHMIHRPDVSVNSDGRVTVLETRENSNPRSYRSMFRDQAMTDGGFRDLGEFLDIAVSRKYEPRLEARAFIEGDGALGGYSVPETWAGSIFDQALEREIVRPRASVYPMRSNTLNVPAWDNGDHTDGSLYGGFTVSYLSENSAADVQTGKLRSVKLTAKKIGLYCEISREAAADGISLDRQVQEKMAAAVSFVLDRDFLTGNGVGKPLGVLNAGSLVSINRATANQISYDDVVSLYSRLYPGSVGNAVWIANVNTVPQLANIRDTGNNNLWIQSASAGVPSRLFGLPLMLTEKLPGLGSKGDLMLVDFSQYAIGMRQEAIIDVSNAPGWTRDVISLRVIVRVDGSPLWDSAITPNTGSDSLSWAVALDVPA